MLTIPPETRRELDRIIALLREAARVVADRAGVLELHAAKNAAAGRTKGEASKLTRAAELRRAAVFLADSRLHTLLRRDPSLADLLLTQPHGSVHSAPRKLPQDVQPSRARPFYREAAWYDDEGQPHDESP